MKTVHAALSCKDPLAIERFYTRNFGFTRARVIPLGEGEQIIFLKSGSFYLELFKAKGESPLAPPENDGYAFPCVRHIAFQVDDVDAKLAEMGSEARVSLGPFGFDDFIPGWRTVWLRDPEGNIVEVSQGFCDQADPPPFAVGEPARKDPTAA